MAKASAKYGGERVALAEDSEDLSRLPVDAADRFLQTAVVRSVLELVALGVGNGMDTSLLQHVGAIGWDNVVLYGKYIVDYLLRKVDPDELEATAR